VRCGERSETDIRAQFGDSADVSKALRMLIRARDVVRTGHGGRASPFVYTASREL
jgi:hypothetical protein